ncbi:MAG: hypothetical protein FGM33_01485 [Candidatus Kapabacteria bacterium]|nr:hypothetical protein [Candidatus Kapabacteria bacterium]
MVCTSTDGIDTDQMRYLIRFIVAGAVVASLHAQGGKHPMLTVHRQRVVQSCGAVLDANSTGDDFLMSGTVGLTSIGTISSAPKAKAYLGFWVPIPVILDAGETPTEVVAGARIWSWPNPFRDHVSIDVRTPDGAMAEAAIYNGIGKHVASLEITSRHPEGVTFSWDGSTDEGFTSATGTYVVRVFVREPLHQRRIAYSSTITRVR